MGPWGAVGAWLRLWTPPRDVAVPPVPRRALDVGAAAVVAAAIAAVAWLGPRIEAATLSRERLAAEAAARLEAAEERRLAVEQKVHDGRGGASGATEGRGARAHLLKRVERAIDADARSRVRSGALRGPILRTVCSPYPRTADSARAEADLRRAEGRYECLAVTSDIVQRGDPRAGALGHPFRVRVNYESGRFAWCKANLRPGEGNVGRELASVPLSPRCAG